MMGIADRGARISTAIAAALLLAAAPAAAQDLAVRGDVVYTMAGAPVRDGVVLIERGRIVRVGPASEVAVPAGVRTLTARVVTPGLIDARTTAGLSGIYNSDADQDVSETTGQNQAEIRAYDGFNPREQLLDYLLGLGITTIHTGPAPGSPIAGQTAVFKTAGDLRADMALDSTTMMVFSLGDAPKEAFGRDRKPPTTRMKTAAMIRDALLEGKRYSEEDGPRDLRKEALARVVRGELPALFVAHRADDITTALRIAREFGLNAVIDGGSEAYRVTDEIREAGVPVLVGPIMIRAASEARNATFENAAILDRAGIPFAVQGGYEAYVPKVRVVLWETGVAVQNGLPFGSALRALTVDAARILGIDDRVGTLEPGKDADLALFDGDPFEYTSHVTGVVVDGRLVSEGRAWSAEKALRP